MSLYNHLAHTTNEQLTRIAHSFGVAAMSPSKRNLLHDISKRYKNPEFMMELINDLPEEIRGLLRGLVFFTPAHRDRIEVPEPLAQQWCIHEPLQEHIEILEDKGLLFQISQENLQNKYQPQSNGYLVLPRELRAVLRDAFTQQGQRLKAADVPPLSISPFEVGMIDAVFHLLSVANHSKVSLTQKGLLHRKVYERWLNRCHQNISNELLFDMSSSFCLATNLIDSQHNVFRPTPHVVEWLKKPIHQLKQDLWEYFLNYHVITDSDLQHLLVYLSSAQSKGNEQTPVYAVEDVKDALSIYSINVIDCMQILAGFYAITLDSWDNPRYFTFTNEGRVWLLSEEIDLTSEALEPEPCILQPNFHLLAPPTIGYERLWYLDQLAEFQRQDVFTEFELSQQSILSAMRRGWSAEGVFRLLNEYTAERIPDNVLFSLEEWTSKFGQIHLRKTVLVECKTPELADEVMHVPDVQQLIEDRVSDKHFTVLPENARKLMKFLQDKGYEPSSAKSTFEPR